MLSRYQLFIFALALHPKTDNVHDSAKRGAVQGSISQHSGRLQVMPV